jgi:hypothetical protein
MQCFGSGSGCREVKTGPQKNKKVRTSMFEKLFEELRVLEDPERPFRGKD